MRDLFRVQIGQNADELPHDLLDVVFGQLSVLLRFQVGVERFALNFFQNKTNAGWRLYGFVQAHYSRVVQVC